MRAYCPHLLDWLVSMSDDATIITSIYACTDIGNVRSNNEDNFVITDLYNGRFCLAPQTFRREKDQYRLLIAVSDGMGGAQAGEIASALAVYGLRLELLKNTAITDTPQSLTLALEKINKIIWRAGQEYPHYRGMGAAITAVIIDGTRAFVAEVGDSRAYLIRKNRIKQITTDQSLFEVLVQAGAFKGKQNDENPSRNIILQSLGGQERVKVAVSAVDLRGGDYLLLCSDGLSNKLSAEEIRKFVIKSPNLESACSTMIGVAKKRGGEDNITLVLARFEGNGLVDANETGSITNAIEVLAAFNPLTGEAEKKRDYRTQQMVSDSLNMDNSQAKPVFRSTIGIMPQTEYPEREQALAISDRSVDLLQQSGQQLSEVIEQIHQVEDWLMQQGRLDPSVQKAIAHLEHAIKNVQKIEQVARKARHLIDRVTDKPEK